MSILVACKGLAPEAASDVDPVRVTMLSLSSDYVKALEAWGVGDPGAWLAITSWQGRMVQDLVNDAVGDPEARSLLVGALGSLARSCEELAIWYAGFPDDIPVVESPSEFERILDEQLAAGELEPSVRLDRSACRADPS